LCHDATSSNHLARVTARHNACAENVSDLHKVER
jgi:hypothetical protein